MYKKFVARTLELSGLQNMYNSSRFEMAVIYGRKRVGKTSLIKEFIKDKSAIYVQGIEAVKELNLQYLTESILDFENPDRMDHSFVYTDFRDAFVKVQDIANSQNQKLIFVMDEFPYFAESAPEISSVLQYAVDHIFKEYNNIMLILCGSSMSFMEHQVLGHKSPLYGRRTGQFKVRPFDIFDTKKMLPNVSDNDLLAYYGITGGVPQYLSFVDEGMSLRENIENVFLSPNAVLQDEPKILLQEELRKPATYYSILVAMAHSKTKLNDIAQSVGMTVTTSISPYLKRLTELEIIERKYPILSKKKPIYVIRDSMFRFWFKYISDAQDKIALGRTSATLDYIMNDISDFLGPVFEKASADWLWKNIDLPFEPREIGSWWGSNPILKRQEEIDLIAVNYDNSSALIAECKWRNAEKVNAGMIETLKQRAVLFSSVNNITSNHLMFFAKECTSEFKEYAKKSNIKVITFNDFFEKYPA